MGNGYNHLRDRGFYSKNNSFLPILCRVSIRDVKLKNFRDRSSNSDDPSSPKVSCMGQVKRNTKLIGFPTPYGLTSSSSSSSSAITTTASRNNQSHGNLKYIKLKRFFSGRYLLSSNTSIPTAAVCNSSTSKGICRNGSRRSSKINHDDGGNCHVKQQKQNVEVNLIELDPPLPVVKKVQQPPSEVSLWKRRSGGMTLKSLQIEQIHHLPNNKFQPAPTV